MDADVSMSEGSGDSDEEGEERLSGVDPRSRPWAGLVTRTEAADETTEAEEAVGLEEAELLPLERLPLEMLGRFASSSGKTQTVARFCREGFSLAGDSWSPKASTRSAPIEAALSDLPFGGVPIVGS